MRLLTALLTGLVFGTGIALSGMMNPAKVLNFFDVFGTWDPSLGFVMGGALAVAIPGYRLVLRRPHPAFGPRFQLPDTQRVDARLILGSLTFGAGWGISGFCPGGALPALGTGRTEVFLFVAALVGGLLTARRVQGMAARAAAKPA